MPAPAYVTTSALKAAVLALLRPQLPEVGALEFVRGDVRTALRDRIGEAGGVISTKHPVWGLCSLRAGQPLGGSTNNRGQIIGLESRLDVAVVAHRAGRGRTESAADTLDAVIDRLRYECFDPRAHADLAADVTAGYTGKVKHARYAGDEEIFPEEMWLGHVVTFYLLTDRNPAS